MKDYKRQLKGFDYMMWSVLFCFGFFVFFGGGGGCLECKIECTMTHIR